MQHVYPERNVSVNIPTQTVTKCAIHATRLQVVFNGMVFLCILFEIILFHNMLLRFKIKKANPVKVKGYLNKIKNKKSWK